MDFDARVGIALLAAALLMAGVLLVSGPFLGSHQLPPADTFSPDNDRISANTPAGPTEIAPVPSPAEVNAPSPEATSPDTLSSPAVSGPPSFTLLVTPVEARVRPGDTILYTMTIEPSGGFDQPVSLSLDISALLLYRNSFDLGSVDPPYPRTVEYSFRVPSDVPGGITVKGTLAAEGGGHREEQDLILIVGM